MPRLLIVDDSPTQTLMLATSLMQQNYIVEIESCGVAGLKRAIDHDFDLLILDLNLPDINGLDICRYYKELGHTTPVLLITSEDYLNKIINFQSVGPDYYCVKDKIAILNRVEVILLRQRRAKNLKSLRA